jgi:hypothetical protein
MANSSSGPNERVVVIDERNMVRLWLEEQVATGKLTTAQADAKLKEYENEGKLWIGPAKDMVGTVKIIYKLARDMKSWMGARVYFIKGKTGDLVVIKGWPAGRKLLSGTRYKIDNPKIVELQIGKTGIRAAAKESARFGLYLVVAIDVADYLLYRDQTTLGHLLASLTVDIPSVAIASVVGAAAGAYVAGTSVAGLAVIGTFACGPLIVAFVVGVAVGYALYKLDEHFHLTEKLSEIYDNGLEKLDHVREALGAEAEMRFKQLENSTIVHDLARDARDIAARLGRQGDWVIGKLAHL